MIVEFAGDLSTRTESLEKGQALDAASVPDAPTVVYQIAGTGAVIN